MDYVGRIFRPPSEARSLLLQVTVGCSHNRCSFCDMYLDKRFRPKPLETIEADIAEAKSLGPRFDRVFLCDGDALSLGQRRLMPILEAIERELPWVKRVGTYGDTRGVGRRSVQELRELREAGLGIVYHGVESGDDRVLSAIDKGATADECAETAEKLRDAGITHSVMVLLGIGGAEGSVEHARATAALLSRMQPAYVGALTTTIVPGTPLAAQAERGEFELPGKFEMLEELRILIAESDLRQTRFSSNHASNYLPVRAELPRDRERILETLDQVLASRDEGRLKPESMRGL